MLQGSEKLGSLEVQNAALFVILLSQLGSGIFGSVHVHVAQGGREAGSSLKVRFVEHAESPQDFALDVHLLCPWPRSRTGASTGNLPSQHGGHYPL